jgi:DNA-binding XRE family transcriptional regulator
MPKKRIGQIAEAGDHFDNHSDSLVLPDQGTRCVRCHAFISSAAEVRFWRNGLIRYRWNCAACGHIFETIIQARQFKSPAQEQLLLLFEEWLGYATIQEDELKVLKNGRGDRQTERSAVHSAFASWLERAHSEKAAAAAVNAVSSEELTRLMAYDASAVIETILDRKAITSRDGTRAVSSDKGAALVTSPSRETSMRPINTTEIGNVIANARMAAGLTQHELAQRMKTDQANIARLERGRSLPSTRTLQRIARATGRRLVIGFERLRR